MKEGNLSNRLFAVIEDGRVINVIVGIEDDVLAANPSKFIEYTEGWDYNNGIDGGAFFPRPTLTAKPIIEEEPAD